ncbi:hypothetical protein B7P43_G13060 [Cryptotermes secundus]|uniref:Cytochrome b5 heme-binding domain-containing protein n=1 Tax=Cryptotermes secundus TaxID=105785 RepID=A0A2J7QMB5_9NEOP|nr:hypothetical protein B7P43_G13060 [Cryptotermes secundus]
MGSDIDLRGKRKEMLFSKEKLKKHTDGSKGLYLAILGKVYDVGKGEKFYGPSGSYHFFTDLRGKRKEMLFSKEKLKKHTDGSKGLYLAILGKVYDVGKGEKFYGPSGSYHFFTGRDGSRAFITGDFTESGLTDDVIGLTPQELHSLHEWAQFYRREYKYLGKVIGRYYDTEGQPTPYYHQTVFCYHDMDTPCHLSFLNSWKLHKDQFGQFPNAAASTVGTMHILAHTYNQSTSTICTILKNKDKIKEIDASEGVARISMQRLRILDDVESCSSYG